MATGPVNSQTALSPATILRSGESLATTAAALKDKNAKTFYHMIPGARVCMPDGLEVRFFGGQFVTADPGIIAELNKIVDKPTSMIYSNQDVAAHISAVTLQLASDAGDTSGKTPE